MNMQIFWFLPTHGDGRYLGTTTGGRATTYSYFRQIAEAAETLGYSGVLVPTGRSCEDSWILAASLLPVTQRLRFLVAVRPGVLLPSAAARMAATLDRISNGRLLINVVAGGDPAELAGDGIFLDHDERYEAADEFLSVWKALFRGEEVDFNGRHLQVRGGKLLFPPVQHPHPPLFFGGSSPAGHQVAAKHVDVYLTWGEPPAQVAEKIGEVRRLAAEQGRTVRFGIRLHVIVRETEREAWEAADRLIRYLDSETIASAQQVFARFDSEGQRRMARLHNGSRESLEISPNLWAGIGLVRGGAGTALVGDPETVAERLREYADLGIEKFILSGYPHLEEAYRVSELLFPLLPLENGPTPVRSLGLSPFGEIVANDQFPKRKEGVV